MKLFENELEVIYALLKKEKDELNKVTNPSTEHIQHSSMIRHLVTKFEIEGGFK